MKQSKIRITRTFFFHKRSEQFWNPNTISEPPNPGDAGRNLFHIDRYFNYQAPQKWMQIHENKIGPTNSHNGVKLNLFSHLNILHSFLVCFPSPSFVNRIFGRKSRQIVEGIHKIR